MSFGVRLRELRMRAGMKQVDLAQRIHVRAHTLWRYEDGKLTPRAEILRRIAEVLSSQLGEEITIDKLLDESSEVHRGNSASADIRAQQRTADENEAGKNAFETAPTIPVPRPRLA